ncbi:MAG: type II toxin-antitoxin system RelE/ParE family toxin [Candidatus Acidiferrales bacterium]
MTARRVSIHPAALEEAEAAARAAVRFVEEIDQVIGGILAAPQRWQRDPGGTRKVKLPCFPFLIIYRESNGTIQILAVAHGRRRPGYWKTRL